MCKHQRKERLSTTCSDVDDQKTNNAGKNCSVNHLPRYYHQFPSSLSGEDSNEEQDVGHGFKRPIV